MKKQFSNLETSKEITIRILPTSNTAFNRYFHMRETRESKRKKKIKNIFS